MNSLAVSKFYHCNQILPVKGSGRAQTTTVSFGTREDPSFDESNPSKIAASVLNRKVRHVGLKQGNPSPESPYESQSLGDHKSL